jgi:hypothetical protein
LEGAAAFYRMEMHSIDNIGLSAMALKNTQFICFLISSLTREEVGKKYTR